MEGHERKFNMEYDEDAPELTDLWDMRDKTICPIHKENCPGDDGGFFIDGNHPDDMFSVQPEEKKRMKVIRK